MTSATPEIHLEIFEGPLDLLLYLIRKDDLNIYDIPISQITSEYLSYLDVMKDMRLDMAGEFLVMASTLLQIKARTLLPQDSVAEADEGPDPRADLVAKLLEYQKFKEASSFLAQREYASREVFYRNVLPAFSEEDFTLEATLFDLLDAFKDVLKNAGEEVKELLYQEIPLEQKVREILDLLDRQDCIQFSQIFSAAKTRRELIMTFLALLELIRMKQVVAKQLEDFGEIRIYRLKETLEADANLSSGTEPSSPLAGED